MPCLLETKDLCYAYEDGTKALKNLCLSVEKGSVTGILGGNGAGKSTLFLTLNGVLTPESGQVIFDGKPVTYGRKDMVALRRKVGIVFQDPDDQLFSADVYRDISFGPVNLGLPEEEVHQRVARAMTQTGTTDLQNKPTHALSYGQKKRVAIAGVLAMEPELMILDEPTAGLDPQGVSEIMSLLKELKQARNITILLATHDMDLVPLYCDQVYLLDGGAVVKEGTPQVLFEDPSYLRQIHLRLPRIAHLMEILADKDGLNLDKSVATISGARRELLHLLQEEKP